MKKYKAEKLRYGHVSRSEAFKNNDIKHGNIEQKNNPHWALDYDRLISRNLVKRTETVNLGYQNIDIL